MLDNNVFDLIKAKFRPNHPLPIQKVLELKAKSDTYLAKKKENSSVDRSKITENQMSFGLVVAETSAKVRSEIELELVKHFFDTTEEELNQIDAIDQYPELINMIKETKPSVINFFNLGG